MTPPLPFDRLGPYRLARRLGRGGMADVFLAAELAGEAELERALIEEARLGARLRHRNLVGVLGLGTDRGTYYVVLEWIDGGDLGALLAAAPLPATLALLVAEEVALGLAY